MISDNMSNLPAMVISWLWTTLISFSVLALLLIIYRCIFHPLSRYPGPFSAKLSSFYLTYYVARGNLHVKQRLLHKEYGPVVRVGPNRLMFESSKALHEIYQSRKVRKSIGYAATNPVPGITNIFTTIDTNVHSLKRKALSPGFSEQFVRKFEKVIEKNVDIFVDQLLPTPKSVGWSVPHNMSDRCKYFTLDIMGVFGFGRSFNVQTEDTNRGIILGMRPGAIISGIYAQFPELRRLALHKHIKVNGAWTQAHHGAFCRKLITERVKLARDAEPGLFSLIIETKDEETGNVFKLDDLWAESRFFLIAGSDTSATVLSSVFFYLSRFPSCHKKLVEELTGTFKTREEIQLGQNLSGCRYLRAVLDESMRLSPPVGNALWREVCEAGQMIDGDYIPPGVEVGVSLYSLFHSDKVFPEPDVFIPERFLENGRFPDHLQQARSTFNPFSLGRRNCAGMNLAYAEMTLLLAKTVWTLDFKCPEGPKVQVGEGSLTGMPGRRVVDEFQIKTFITSLHDGPYLQFRHRPTQ